MTLAELKKDVLEWFSPWARTDHINLLIKDQATHYLVAVCVPRRMTILRSVSKKWLDGRTWKDVVAECPNNVVLDTDDMLWLMECMDQCLSPCQGDEPRTIEDV